MPEDLSEREGVPRKKHPVVTWDLYQNDPPGAPEDHLAGWPCNRNAYTKGCRCDWCKAAQYEYGRTKRPRKELPHGSLSRYTSKNYACRCDLCRGAFREYTRERRNRKRVEEGQAPLPSRPPGWCWTDDSGITTVVRCERCDKNYGPWIFDYEGALAFAAKHREMHAGEPAFDWTAYDKARLMKHPGGRPPQEGYCSEAACLKRPHAKGLCERHYKASRRAL